jgi:leucyl aminopeptidase
MRRILPCLAAGLLIGAAPAPTDARTSSPAVWVTFEASAANAMQEAFAAQGLVPPSIDETRHGIAVSLVREDQLDVLSAVMHERFMRCPGFVSHVSRADALRAIEPAPPVQELTDFYVIDNAAAVNGILPHLRAANIEQTITGLSSFSTRRHDQSGGMAAALWLRDQWQALPLARFGATVELYNVATTPQPSVILTIPGSRRPDQVVVIGGHLDSINQVEGPTGLAPGADDDASGVATLTEVMRAAFAAGFRPERTVKFMAYSGEEVGLRGSRAIATAHRAANVNVVGVLQLDMTNFKGSAHADIAIVADVNWTSFTQNQFLKVLIDTYVGVPWIETTCGYGCSDHVAWTEKSYRASFPFESQFGFHNPNIHKTSDTLANSGGNAEHSLKFAKLAAAYLAEVAKGSLVSPPFLPDASVPTVAGAAAR